VSQVEWALTVKRREKLLKETRTRAVHDAVTRAQQYAEALGLSGVRPVAVAELVPEHIDVSATVDARFVVGDG